jgi:NAD(P)-dependent dehydrogenase (short-subunit alcohol dehydrogenase family)
MTLSSPNQGLPNQGLPNQSLPNQSLPNQRALVTGASRGIGRAICLALGAQGASIVIHYHRNREAAEEVAAQLPWPSVLVQADLASTQAVTGMIETLADNSLDILVNNAGVWKATPLGSTGESLLDEILDVNLKSMFWLTQAALPKLREGARIVNLSSTAGRVGIAAGRSLYGATKAAVDSLTKSWALELASRKIRVNAVAPGYVETDMTAAYLADPATREGALLRHPLGRFGTVQDVAAVVAFLCSDAAQFVSGQSLNVSGGFVV